MKKYLPILFLITFIIPSVTFASWWNPFTWKVFQRQAREKIEEVIVSPVSTSSVAVEIEQSKADKQTAEIEQLRKEVEELKKKTDPVISIPTPPVTPVVTNNNTQATTSKIISSVKAPTSEQIKRLMWWCSLPDVPTCTNTVINFFYTDLSFREAMDQKFIDIQEALDENQQDLYDQKNEQYECLMEPTPVELRTLSPQQQQRIRESKCGTATPSSDLNYKLYQQQQYQDCVTRNLSNYDTTCSYLKPTFY